MRSRRVPDETGPNAWSRGLEARRAAGARLLDLTDANPARSGLGPSLDALVEATRHPDARAYAPDPRGLMTAREAVARYHAERGARVAPDDVVLTAGTSEGYAHLFRLLAAPGEAVLAPAPSYPLFEPIARLEGITLTPYRLAFDGAWHLDRESLEQGLAGGARAVIVVEPNHPTGTCLELADRDWLIRACATRDVAIISDEVFGDFGWEGALPTLAGEQRALTFVLSGLSKVCGLPQLKLGWIALSGPEQQRAEALRGLEWIADLFLTVATPVQLAAGALLEDRGAFQTRAHTRIAANLEQLDRWCAEHPETTRLPAQGGWTAVVRLPRTRSDEDWALTLLERDVVVHPGHFYDFADEGHVVVSLIVPPEVLEEALPRWSAALEQEPAPPR